MRELLDFVARALVERPEAVEIHEERDGGDVRLELRVDPRDVARVVGQGQTAQALRALLSACAGRQQRVELWIDGETEGRVD